MASKIAVWPVTRERWTDLAALFGPRGACAGCWCMYWRRAAPDFLRGRGQANRASLRRLVTSGRIPGLLAYLDRMPVGWCSVAPRDSFPRLERARVLPRIDAEPVWSVVCFYVARGYRRRGVSVALLEGAASFARRQGARILEGYPVDPRESDYADAFAWTGTAAAFREAGFTEARRVSPIRPIMRRLLDA
jgi:GNAT superfamily N-acetyltransferase